jgi:hypothetical protein
MVVHLSKQFYFCLIVIAISSTICNSELQAQIRGGSRIDRINAIQNSTANPSMGPVTGSSSGSSGRGPFKDTLQHRTGMEDSASILYRYMDEDRFYFQDSSVHDFSKRWPVPWSNIFLGNTGSATRSLIFSPFSQAGWDHGLHSYDVYHADPYQSRFFNVTRPFSELSYILGSRSEQNIGVFHTQNIRYNWNFSFDYKLVNAPGIFRNQKNSHDKYLLNSWYKSKNNRYLIFFAAGSSKTGATENGGLTNNQLLKDIPTYTDRFTIPTYLGGAQFESRTLLSNVINTGNIYQKKEIVFRNSYDFGRRDSVKSDTGFQYFFIPRFRLQHTYGYRQYSFRYEDKRVDTAGYIKLYELRNVTDGFRLEDRWKIHDNEFSLMLFPDMNNSAHRIKGSIAYQQIEGDLGETGVSFYNLTAGGDYDNRTRNGKWNFHLGGVFYFQGDYSGDYQAEMNLTRFLGKQRNLLSISLLNVNRTPSFIHNDLSDFKLFNRGNTNFFKENSTQLSARYQLPKSKMDIGMKYIFLSNYVYFQSNRISRQESTLFNVTQFSIAKKFSITKSWSWYTDIILQQATADAPVNLPLLLSRNRIAYEGTYFKNLNLSTGIECRYVSPFKADGYSPVLGQFFLQNDTTIANLPDITAYVHIRIRSWYLFIRAENLNAVRFTPQFGFFENNFAAPNYPTPGLIFRLGIHWGMVN